MLGRAITGEIIFSLWTMPSDSSKNLTPNSNHTLLSMREQYPLIVLLLCLFFKVEISNLPNSEGVSSRLQKSSGARSGPSASSKETCGHYELAKNDCFDQLIGLLVALASCLQSHLIRTSYVTSFFTNTMGKRSSLSRGLILQALTTL